MSLSKVSKTCPSLSARVASWLQWLAGPVLALAASAPAQAITPVPHMTVVAAHSGKCLNVPASSLGTGVGLIQYDCVNAPNDQFRFEPMADGHYRVVARHSGHCLAVQGASGAAGTVVVQAQCGNGAEQQWRLQSTGDGRTHTLRARQSGQCLNIAGNSSANGAGVIQWPCVGAANERFVLGGGQAWAEERPVALQALHSGQCLDVEAASLAQEAGVVQWPCSGTGNQSWRLRPVGAYFQVVVQHSGQCLNVSKASQQAGARLIQWPCVGADNELFSLRPDPTGQHHMLVAKHSGQCVNVNWASQAAGQRMIQWPCGDDANSKLNLIAPNAVAAWSAGPTLPLVGAAASNLKNGKILFWSASNQFDFPAWGRTYTALYDPLTGSTQQTLVTETGHDMFCPGTTLLTDGRLLVNGGNSDRTTSLYDPDSNRWTPLPAMTQGRGYNANTILADGSVLTVGGAWSGGRYVKNGERFAGGRWNGLPGVDASRMRTADAEDRRNGDTYRADNHMWLFPVSGGRVLQAGPSRQMHWLRTDGSGATTFAGWRADAADAMNGTAVMYDGRNILAAGGAPDYQYTNASNDALLIDTAPANPAVTRVAPMQWPRGYHNAVVLPTGQVMVVGGQTYVYPFNDQNAVMAAELWDPQLRTFQRLPAMRTPRTYHGVAILQMDGRVIVAGGGLCGDGCGNTRGANHPGTEIITPPYLYDANGRLRTNRPVITAAPASAAPGEAINVRTDAPVSAFSLVRMGASTHTVNNDQRRIPLQATSADGLNHTMGLPADGSVLLPGYYMLFAMDASGTPSIARAIQVRVRGG